MPSLTSSSGSILGGIEDALSGVIQFILAIFQHAWHAIEGIVNTALSLVMQVVNTAIATVSSVVGLVFGNIFSLLLIGFGIVLALFFAGSAKKSSSKPKATKSRAKKRV